MKLVRRLALGSIFVLAAVGCVSGPDPDKNSNTNWLQVCETRNDCDEGDSCICGVCTQECTINAACNGHGDVEATCVDPRQDGIASSCAGGGLGMVSVCLLDCSEDAECHEGQRCLRGACVTSSAIEREGMLRGPCSSEGECDDGLACNAMQTCVEPSLPLDAGIDVDDAGVEPDAAIAGDCPKGHRHGSAGVSCEDIDECAEQSDECAEDAVCSNTKGSYKCACSSRKLGDGKTCETVLPLVTARGHHSCAILANGTLHCWGKNETGQAGAPLSELVVAPSQIGNNDDWTEVAAGYDFTCAVRSGTLYCWGNNDLGQTAQADATPDPKPRRVGNRTDWTLLSAQYYRACGIAGGELYCWGAAWKDGSTLAGPVTRLGEASDRWTDVAVGDGHICGIRDGRLYCWGSNYRSALGFKGDYRENIGSPVDEHTDWSAVAAGAMHTCAIRSGRLYCWGGNDYGQVGNGDTNISVDQITRVVDDRGRKASNDDDWEAISAGTFSTCGLRDDQVFCWGGDGQGHIEVPVETVPTHPGHLFSLGWTRVSAGGEHSCGVRNGDVRCWGSNGWRQLAQERYGIHLSPERIGTSTSWTAVDTDRFSNCGVNGGSLYCWGRGFYGELGSGKASDVMFAPNLVDAGGSWTVAAAGSRQACGIRDSEAYCWGTGTLGNGLREVLRPAPVRAGNQDGWTSIAAGYDHACGVRVGELYCWGGYRYGSEGEITGPASTTPLRIGDATNWTRVFSGDFLDSAYGLRDDTSIYSWGGYSSDEPMQSLGVATGYQAVAYTPKHQCVIQTGSLFCWGTDDNDFGVLGLGDVSTVSMPTQVGSATNWQEISTSESHTCGIAGGALYCWGNNRFGHLGIGSTISSNVPVQVGTDTDWEAISVAGTNDHYLSVYGHTCGIRAGELYCWGHGLDAQLGVGNLLHAEPATVVFP